MFKWPKGNTLILPLLVVLTLFNTITSNINTTIVTAITTMPKGMKMKLSRDSEGEGELNHDVPSVCRLSKGCNSNILGAVWWVKLKLTGLVLRDFQLTKRKYLHPKVITFTHTTTTVTITTTSITTTSITTTSITTTTTKT